MSDGRPGTSSVLTFNTLLAAVGVEPTGVRLVRHRHGRDHQLAVYLDAVNRRPRFEDYQRCQSNPRVVGQMRNAFALASFVIDPRGDTVFVGLWAVKGVESGYVQDPYRVGPPPTRESWVFALEPLTALSEFCGRVVIDWGAGERAWVQYAHRREKPIAEIRARAEEPPFPGFARLRCGLHEVQALPNGWLDALRSTNGIYLLVHRDSGRQYVGSAVGAGGFLGRWRSYADGHGGNVALRELGHPADAFDACILETAGSSATTEDVYALESNWKEKLGSRVTGLNRN